MISHKLIRDIHPAIGGVDENLVHAPMAKTVSSPKLKSMRNLETAGLPVTDPAG